MALLLSNSLVYHSFRSAVTESHWTPVGKSWATPCVWPIDLPDCFDHYYTINQCSSSIIIIIIFLNFSSYFNLTVTWFRWSYSKKMTELPGQWSQMLNSPPHLISAYLIYSDKGMLWLCGYSCWKCRITNWMILSTLKTYKGSVMYCETSD